MANKTPKGLELNNPTNIRKNILSPWNGEMPCKGEFCKFINRKFAYRATFIILRSYVHKHGCKTLKDCITRWAPPTENDTDRYVRFVSNMSCYPEAIKIDLGNQRMMCNIVRAMVQMEVGIKENMETIVDGYILAAKTYNMQNQTKER